jgi:hypothetical protein
VKTSTASAAWLHGGDGSDTLLFDSAQQPIVPQAPETPDGSIKVLGHGWLNYQNIDHIPGFAAALVDTHGPYSITEGSGITLHGSATPATYTHIETVVWDLNGDAIFGDATGLEPHLDWSDLVNLGLDDDGAYDLTLKVIDDQGAAASSTGTLTITNRVPAIFASGPSMTSIGADHEIEFSASDPGDDTVSQWTVNWGDGAVDTFGSDAQTAWHVYENPGTFTVRITAQDEDGVHGPRTLGVTVKTATPDAGGPYTITEGDSLTLEATVGGTPVSVTWDVHGDGTFGDASGLNPTLTWSRLNELRIDDNGTRSVQARAFFGSFVVMSPVVGLTIDNAPPTARLDNDGPVAIAHVRGLGGLDRRALNGSGARGDPSQRLNGDSLWKRAVAHGPLVPSFSLRLSTLPRRRPPSEIWAPRHASHPLG